MVEAIFFPTLIRTYFVTQGALTFGIELKLGPAHSQKNGKLCGSSLIVQLLLLFLTCCFVSKRGSVNITVVFFSPFT